jgi:hypothetical protein
MVVIELLAPGECSRSAGTGCVFPLGFGEEPISVIVPGLPVDPAHVGLCVIPAHAHDRAGATTPVLKRLVGLAFPIQAQCGVHRSAVADTVTHTGFPLIPGDFCLADREGARNGHLMLMFVIAAEFLRGGRTHRE